MTEIISKPKETSDRDSRKRPRVGVLVEPFQRQLYEMIVRQLRHDGFLAAASTVADAASVCLGSTWSEGLQGDRLARLTANGLAVESLEQQELDLHRATNVVERYISASKVYLPLHLANATQIGAKVYRWSHKFATSSLGGVIRDVSFAANGAYATCAGTNGLALIFSLKTLEDIATVEQVRVSNRLRGLDWSQGGGKSQNNSSSLPNANDITELSVARRITGFTQSVEVMRFHPNGPLVLCGGRAGELAVYNVGPTDIKAEMRFQDAFPVRTAAWHPSGEYILFGTDNPSPRLINVETRDVLMAPQTVTRNAPEGLRTSGALEHSMELKTIQQHSAGLTAVQFSGDGRTWASASLDGSWALCDGSTGKIIHKVHSAHSRVPVTSVLFSRSGGVLLTSGMDSTARLWDLRYLPRNGSQPTASSPPATTATSTTNTSSTSTRAPGDGGGAGSNASPGPSAGPHRSFSNHNCEVMSFGAPVKCEQRSIKAVFSSDESHILCQNADLTAINGYCVYSGDLAYTLGTESSSMQRGLAVSPFRNLVITGGDDCRLRLWSPSWVSSS